MFVLQLFMDAVSVAECAASDGDTSGVSGGSKGQAAAYICKEMQGLLQVRS